MSTVAERTDDSVRVHNGRPLTKHEYDRLTADMDEMIEHHKKPEVQAKDAEHQVVMSEKWGDQYDPKPELERYEEARAAIDESWESGKILSGPGADEAAIAPKDADVTDTTGISQKDWDALDDDDWVTVYHVDDTELSEAFAREGITGKNKTGNVGADIRKEQGQTGEGTYVGSNIDEIGGMYSKVAGGGGAESTVIAIKVRKGEVLKPTELSGGHSTVLDGLRHKNVGAVLIGDIPPDNISIVKRMGDEPFEHGGRSINEIQIAKAERDVGLLESKLKMARGDAAREKREALRPQLDKYADQIEEALEGNQKILQDLQTGGRADVSPPAGTTDRVAEDIAAMDLPGTQVAPEVSDQDRITQTMEWLQSDDGSYWLNELTRTAHPEYKNLLSTDEGLRAYLEGAYARAHLKAGGEYIYIKPDGTYIDDSGVAHQMTADQIKKYKGAQGYVVTRPGDQRILDAYSTGKLGDHNVRRRFVGSDTKRRGAVEGRETLTDVRKVKAEIREIVGNEVEQGSNFPTAVKSNR